MRHFTTRWTGLKGFLATLLTLSLWSAGSQAADLPGKGVTVQPCKARLPKKLSRLC